MQETLAGRRQIDEHGQVKAGGRGAIQGLRAREQDVHHPLGPRHAERVPSRKGRRAVTFYTIPEAHRQLRLLSVELDRSVQTLGVDSLNLLFAQHG